MKQRTLGQELVVSAVGLGCMGLSGTYGPTDESDPIDVLRHAVDVGVTFLDTADFYGANDNERLVAEALDGRRDQVVIATKFGHEIDGDKKFVRINGRPEYVRKACDASLQRLQIDVIDLYYQHRVDPDVAIEDTWGAMHDLVEAGKVRHLGISEAAPATIRRAHAVHPITACQTEWSLWTRDPEVNGVLDTVRELGIGFVPYSPVGRGVFSGQVRSAGELPAGDFRRNLPRFQPAALDQNLALVDEVAQISAELGITTPQLAIAWLLHQGPDVVPIPGTKRIRYLDENAGATEIELPDDVLTRLDTVAPVGRAVGDRNVTMNRLNL